MKYRVGNKQSHGVGCYASGGRVSEDISDAGSLPTMSGKSDTSDMAGVGGGKAKSRLDRGKKGATTVNIVIAGGKSDQPPAAPMPMPLPPPPMAGPPPGAPPMPPGPPMGGPPMMRKNGGRVMTAGAGSGLGRLEKLGKK